MIQPGQDVRISGATSLAVAPRWGGGGFAVQERGSLALASVSLDASVSFTVVGGGSLSLASMAVPGAVLAAAQYQLTDRCALLFLCPATRSTDP
eukprot:COSAG06_NODE_6394_length_2949_cov_2.226316_2_plen_93_part_01